MEFARVYKEGIDQLVQVAGPAPLLHVHAGLGIFLLVRLLATGRRSTSRALQAVIAAEMVNEALDWLAQSPGWTVRDTASDILLTLLWPTAIVLVTQLRRRAALPARRARAAGAASRRAGPRRDRPSAAERRTIDARDPRQMAVGQPRVDPAVGAVPVIVVG